MTEIKVSEPGVIYYPEGFDYRKQAVEIPNTRKPGQTGIYRNGAWQELINFNDEVARRSLYEVFLSGLQHSPQRPCLGHRELISSKPLKFAPHYTWMTYTQVDERRRYIGSALDYMWQQKRAGGTDLPTVGIWSQNRPEWQLVDLAVQAYAKVSVCLYETLGSNSVEYICNHAELSIIFVAGYHISTLLALAPRLKFLKMVVSMDELPEQARQIANDWAKNVNVEFLTFKEFEAIGKLNFRDPVIPTSDQLYSICYTSGTTGDPKGVILTHGQCAVAVCSGGFGVDFIDPGRLLSFLPLAHILGRIIELFALNQGGAIGYFTGDPLRLMEDAQCLKPTGLPGVPRVFNRIYQAIHAVADVPGLRGDIFRRAVREKLARLHATGQVTHPIWDVLVFRKVRNVLGGHIHDMLSGSAPISADVINFLKIAFSCEIYEGMVDYGKECYSRYLLQVIIKNRYGATETVCISTRTLKGDPTSSGTVGPPQPACELKLVDVPSLGYTSGDKPNPRGELCCRGLNVMKGYYKDENSTRNAIDEQGWYHSGDIAEIDSCGRFKIIDRVKNVIKLAQGEFVALERLESLYAGSPSVEQIYVHGDPLREYLVAVVVPNENYIANEITKLTGKTVTAADTAALNTFIKDERIRNVILDELSKQAKRVGLNGFETIKNIHLTWEKFTEENDTITPSLKIKRRGAHKMYAEVVDDLYRRPIASLNSGVKL